MFCLLIFNGLISQLINIKGYGISAILILLNLNINMRKNNYFSLHHLLDLLDIVFIFRWYSSRASKIEKLHFHDTECASRYNRFVLCRRNLFKDEREWGTAPSVLPYSTISRGIVEQRGYFPADHCII